MKRILLIGPSKANIGGVSMHLSRLMAAMGDNCEFDFIDEGRKREDGVFNLRSLNIFTYLKKVFKADVVHIHSGAFILRFLNVLVCRILLRKFTIVTFHRDPYIDKYSSVTRFMLSFCNDVIAVSKNGYKFLKTEGKCRYHMQPAYLPPVIEDEPPVDDELRAWIDRARSSLDSVLMVSNASAIVFIHGEEVYGIDMCLEATKSLRQQGVNCYLIFVIVQCNHQEKLNEYKQYIIDNNLQDYVLLLERPCSFLRLMKESDIVLRTTNTDGDSISVREALSLGVPIISSDVIERPSGTILFKTRDTQDLVKKIIETISNKEVQPFVDKTDYEAFYSSIYRL